jgi:hypothetical protein
LARMSAICISTSGVAATEDRLARRTAARSIIAPAVSVSCQYSGVNVASVWWRGSVSVGICGEGAGATRDMFARRRTATRSIIAPTRRKRRYLVGWDGGEGTLIANRTLVPGPSPEVQRQQIERQKRHQTTTAVRGGFY